MENKKKICTKFAHRAISQQVLIRLNVVLLALRGK